MPSDIFPIILNSTNAVSNQPDTYVYKFPRNSINLKNASVAVNNINLYYSWGNVSQSLYNNTTFGFLFPDTAGSTNYTVTLPDGNYEVEDINAYLQKVFVDNRLYNINTSTGQYRYYMELKANPVTYSIDLVCYTVPTSTPSGYSDPPGGFGNGYPLQPEQPFLNIFDNNFGSLIGYIPGLHLDTTSSFTPQIAEVSSVLVRCSLISNKFTNPNDICFSFTTKGQKYGSMIAVENNNLVFNRIPDGIYTEVIIRFIDQKYRRLNIKDTNLVIYLVVQIES